MLDVLAPRNKKMFQAWSQEIWEIFVKHQGNFSPFRCSDHCRVEHLETFLKFVLLTCMCQVVQYFLKGKRQELVSTYEEMYYKRNYSFVIKWSFRSCSFFFYNLRKLIKVWQWQISSLLSGYSHQCIIFADMLYNFGNVKLGENPRKKSD